jgi:hypothetical protein
MFNLAAPKTILALFPRKYLFPILAFAVPFLTRAVPEVLMGHYIVGFDTIAYYVPSITSWLRGGADVWSVFGSAPLFYAIVASAVALGSPLVTVLKIVPVFLHGFLGLSMYGYANKGLGWSPKKSGLAALIGTVYFVAMRVSWDLLRNELAIIFLFVTLTLLSKEERAPRSWKLHSLLSLSMMSVVLAHQLVCIIMIGIVIVFIALRVLRHNYSKVALLFATSLPAILFFAFVYLSPSVGANPIDFTANFGWPLSSFSSYPSMLLGEAGFFLHCYLPLVPLVLLGARRSVSLELKAWLLVTTILLFIPIITLSNYRWTLLFVYPLALLATDSISAVKLVSWKRFKITKRRVVIIYLVAVLSVLTVGFMIQTPETPFFYFRADGLNPFIYQIPSAMLQNTISVNDCQDTDKSLQWFNNNTEENALLLTHRAFYGWAIMSLSKGQIVLYEFGDPVAAAQNATLTASGSVYLIWWTDGVGWYGFPTVPTPFQEVYHSGRIAIYRYLTNSS